MATKRKFKSVAFEAIHSSASALYRVGAISDTKMQEFDEMTTPTKTDTRTNPHNGGSFDDFLKNEGIFDEVHEKAHQRALGEHDALTRHTARAERGDAKVGLKLLDKLDRHFSKDADRR